jgi:hypothetical protein
MCSRIFPSHQWGGVESKKYMSQKRMFDKAIIDTDRFMDLSMSGKALYFLLGMEADDEGFVSYKKVMRIHGGNEDDIKILIAKKFVILFESGVVVITDWNKNNWLDSRRIKKTEYQKERGLISLTDSKEYVLSSGLASIEEYRIEESRVEETMSVGTDAFNQFWNKYPKKELKKKALEIWKRKKLDSSLGEVLAFIEKASTSDRWKKGFIKQPTVFLNGECWNDDVESYNDKYKSNVKEGLELMKF